MSSVINNLKEVTLLLKLAPMLHRLFVIEGNLEKIILSVLNKNSVSFIRYNDASALKN